LIKFIKEYPHLQAMVSRNRLIPVILIVLLVSFTFISPLSASQDPTEITPFIGEDDDYEKEVEVGEKTTFRWTVYFNVSEPYAVKVVTEGFETCHTELTPDFFILHEDESHRIVTLTVELPRAPERRVKEGEVNFTFRRLDEAEPRYQESRRARIEVTGLPPVEDENTIVGGYENPLPEPFDGPLGAFLLNLLIWFIIGMISFFVVTPILHALARKTKTDLDEKIIVMIRFPILILIFLYGMIYSLFRLDIPFDIRASVFQLYALAVLVIGIYLSYKVLGAVLNEIAVRRGGKKSPFGIVLKPVFEKIGLIIILLIGLIISFRILGIEVTAVLAGAGVLGLVVAFAAQDTLSNFFSGIHLLMDRPFAMGDVLLLESGEYCRVEKVGMRSTRLYNIRDHEMIILPNTAIANQKIVNVAKPDSKIRVLVNVGVAYGSDIERVKEILYDVLEDHEDIIHEEGFEPVVRFTEFSDSSLDFNVRFWVDHYLKQWDVASVIRDRIDKEFRDAKVTIPFPQRTVWLKNEDGKDKK